MIGVAVALVLAAGALAVAVSRFDANSYRETVEAAAARATGRALTISGPLKIVPSLMPTVSASGIALANLPGGSRPDMARVERIVITFALMPLLHGKVDVHSIELDGVDVLLERTADGRPNWVFGAPKPAEGAGDGTTLPQLDAVRITRAVVVLRDGTAPAREVRIDSLDVDMTDDGTTIAVKGGLDGRAVSANLSTGALAAVMADTPVPVQGQVDVDALRARVEGTVARPLTGQGLDMRATAEAPALESLNALVGARLPALGAVRVSARVADGPDGAWTLGDLSAEIGALAATGRLVLRPGTPFRIEGELASKRLDIDALSPTPATKRAADGRVIPQLPLDLGLPADVEGRIAVKAEQVRLAGLDLSAVATTLALDGKGLALSPLGLTLVGGRIDGSVRLSRGVSPEVALALKGRSLDLGALLKMLAVTDLVTGRGDFEVSLKGRGADTRSLAAGLGGQTFVALGQGTVASHYLDFIAADLIKILSPLTPRQEDTKVNCAVSRFGLDKGVATSTAFLFDTTRMTMTGEGTVDLRSEAVRFRLAPRPKDRALLSLATDVDVSGTLAKPRFTPSPLGVAKGAARIVGGVLLGPVGVLVPLATSGEADRNPCVEALATKGQVTPKDQGTLDSLRQGLGRTLDDLGTALNPF
jgi:uncharacterized protein involved in outer membrane biogenesis